MSRHEGVSCDSCSKSNFKGKRYKCLICFDYDLCASCHENGTRTTRHTPDHPMQCILTRSDFDLFYGGESIPFDQPQAYTCPYCCKVGISEAALKDHVTSEHASSTNEVICPVCAAMPGGDPNHVTDDLGGHLTLEHRTPMDLEPPLSGRNIRRMFHHARSAASPRGRRANAFPSSSGTVSIASPATFSSARDNVDPIADMLSQLSGLRRTAQQQQSSSATASQLQLLQQQLQFERQQVQQARERLERLPRKPATSVTQSMSCVVSTGSRDSHSVNPADTRFLLPSCFDEQLQSTQASSSDDQAVRRERFAQDVFYAMFSREEDEGASATILTDDDRRADGQALQPVGCSNDADSPARPDCDDVSTSSSPDGLAASARSNGLDTGTLHLKSVNRDESEEAVLNS